MTIAAYIRVSSRAQDHAMQRLAIETHAAQRGDVIARWYAEKQSAKTTERPELARLKAAEGITRLYVYRLDRLARTGIRDMLAILDGFKAAGTQVISVADGFSLEGPTADIIIAVMAWAAQMERLAINERIAGARARMAAEGKPWGHPPSMTVAQKRTALRLKAEGKSVRAIAQALGVKKSVVGRAVQPAAAT